MRATAVALLVGLLPLPAGAVTLDLRSEEVVADGVVVRHYRASSPATDVWVAEVDLCGADLAVEATAAPSGFSSTGSWAASRDAVLASNGDFYTSGPQIYGDAVGDGVRWPADQRGDSASGAWYHRDHGWIAFLHDEVTFTHTRWVKEHGSSSTGWQPGTVAPDPPPGTISLVSGFPELVVDGVPHTCSSPTASDCFPDRTDMRSRHPRTAMGLTEDRGTFLLVAVDGRTGSNSGMYGAELADTLHQLGAHTAFNLDGGGSTQLWADGYVNDASGNNGGGSVRSVANHWAVVAADRPAHCASQPPCEVLPPGGGFVDDEGACFQAFGDERWWRHEEAGFGGHLLWTNAFRSDLPENWAWWRLALAEAGTYAVSAWVEPGYGVHAAVDYEVRAAGVTHAVQVDQGAADGWVDLGTFGFAAGGGQWVSVFDASPVSVSSDQHIAVDAIRLTRVDATCGDGACEPDERCACITDCPVTEEVAGNGLDDDCDGEVDEAAGGGSGGATDGAGGGGDTGSARADAAGAASSADGGCQAAPVGGALGALAGLLALAGRRQRGC